jgi:catechol 2,3-dioxygenase-like lactoylglutathione lyase family enzyme
MSTPHTGAVHHVVLTVSDIKRSVDFYSSHLGFQVAVEFDPRVALSNGHLLLVLTPPPEPAKAIPNDVFDENRIGLDHVSLAVEDKAALEAMAAYLDEQGVVRGEIKDLGSGFAIYVMAVRDPDNIQLELTAPYAS